VVASLSLPLFLLHPLRQYLVLGELLLQVGEFCGWPSWCSPFFHLVTSHARASDESILPKRRELRSICLAVVREQFVRGAALPFIHPALALKFFGAGLGLGCSLGQQSMAAMTLRYPSIASLLPR